MAAPLQSDSISAPGFYGLNTQDSPLDLASGFALVATNCVIDQYGRIGARKGYTLVNPSSGNLGFNDVTVIHELVQIDGTLTIFSGSPVGRLSLVAKLVDFVYWLTIYPILPFLVKSSIF